MKNKRLIQGIGIGYVVCLSTHLLSALLPMYVIFPFWENLLFHGQEDSSDHAHGVLNHLIVDAIMFTSIIIPVALLTFLGHKLVFYFKCKCGVGHNEDPCNDCPHRKS